MFAPADTTPPPSKAGVYLDAALLGRTLSTGSSRERVFKKHKVLPHPRNTVPVVASRRRAQPRPSVDINLTPEDGPQGSSPHSLKHQSRRIGEPDLPPTPPTQSRASSSTHSIYPSSQTYIESPGQSETSISTKIPTTPPNQRSPPTPDVTPPQPGLKLKGSLRPALKDRVSSKATTESRSESFTTARETPYVSEEDDHATPRPRPALPEKASASTVRQIGPDDKQPPQHVDSDAALDLHAKLTPTTKQEFFTFDGDWASSDEVVEQEWDDNLNRNVMVRKRAAQPRRTRVDETRGNSDKVAQDVSALPTVTANSFRPARLREPLQRPPQTQEPTSRDRHWTVQPSPEASTETDPRRLSGMSTKSTGSTVVEAILLDVPPQRHRTLRHVKKRKALRDSGSNYFAISPSSSATRAVLKDETPKRSRPGARPDTARPDSYASSSTVQSLTSRKARREVWKNGGIPVVVIPDRNVSLRSKEASSLRSDSSRRSQRSNSMGSAPISDLSQTKDLTPYFDRPPRQGRSASHRGRTMSESDRSHPFEMEQLTMDYPPAVPVRSSSLSAPTSRHASAPTSHAGSRAGSLTAESLRAHNAVLQEQQTRRRLPKISVEHATSIECIPPERASIEPDGEQLQPVSTVEWYSDGPDQRSLVDQHGDPFFGKRLTAHKAPFSQASVETNGTYGSHGTHGTQFAAEVSEAMAVNIYAHQNTSVLMINHISRAADSNGLLPVEAVGVSSFEGDEESGHFDKPEIIATGPDGIPLTPPIPNVPTTEVDSPLRNPRAPPEPPAIKFTPATPSGHTPAAEKMKMLGNYFEEVMPGKRPSLMKRALSLSRRHSEKGHSRKASLLARTISLSRNIRRDTAENPDFDRSRDISSHPYPMTGDQPPDDARLHPNWRPASSHFEGADDEDYVYDTVEADGQDHHYPVAIDHPPPQRRPSLSQRMKRTFAILPVTDDKHYTLANDRSPQRRTIRRSPSGGLRVVEHRNSYGSLRWPQSRNRSRSPDYETGPAAVFQRSRPSSAPDGGGAGRQAWGIEKRFDTRGRRFFPGWQDKIEQYGLHNLQRRLSERRRQRRTEALRQKISGPREVRDGVGEVTKRNSYKGPSYQSGMQVAGY